MAEYDRDGSRAAPVPDRGSGSPAAAELAAALDGLDRATRNFTSRLSEGQREVERARLAGERAIDETAIAAAAAPGPGSFDHRLREAEREAQSYLESAKRRADSLVASMIEAVEREAAQTRRDAEEAIRARWEQVEVDANRQIENARQVAARMVYERQQRIAKLSDGISERASALTAGMDDAERVRAQFDAFIRALAAAADRIAREPAGRPQPSRAGVADGHPETGTLAA